MGWPTSRDNWRKLKPLARELRKDPTPAERAIWPALRKGRLKGYRFQRQRVFERFVADLYCPRAKLAIEIDGAVHEQQQDADANRQSYLEGTGIRVIRFSNEDVLKRLPHVLDAIADALRSAPPPRRTRRVRK